MAQNSKIKEFPDISTKLTAPTKKSLFEKQKAEAEAKRQREQQETAAVYEDFIKSFDDADDGPASSNFNARGGSGGFGSSGGGTPFGGPSKRHFSGTPTGPAARGGFGGGFSGGRGHSGPGSLGPPPPLLSRKRAHDGSHLPHKDSSTGLFAFEDSAPGPLDAKAVFQANQDDDDTAGNVHAHERVVPKPTLRLSFLPPGTSPAAIKALFPSAVIVDAVRILPSNNTGINTTERRFNSAIVTLAKETPAIDIDTTVNALQNRYLGRGFYLSLSRYFSAAMDLPPLGSSSNSSLPFGARPIPTGSGAGFGRGRPGGSHRGGFAPPQSYAPTGPAQSGRGAPATQVIVAPPSDLSQLKLIHKTLEALLTHGPEFEALLMSRKDVQSEQKWAWLWDSRSQGGVYYRWRLWDILSGGQQRRAARAGSGPPPQAIFEGGPVFVAPERGLPYEYTTQLEDFVSDSDYDSSDEDDSGDEGRRRHLHFQGGAPPPEATNLEGDDQTYLNPLQKARLTHLLARLPTTNAKLRRGDVARVTAFAIEHADEGAEEVVDLITLNVQRPFNFSAANPDYRGPGNEIAKRGDEETAEEDKKSMEPEDTSSSKLIGLFIISDILSSSSTSGIRHAWRYRQLFEASLRRNQVFEGLGRLEKVMHWGRMRAEKWKRSIQSVLTLWEGWCVFPQASQSLFSLVFNVPPLSAEEEAANAAAEKASVAALAAKSRWKTVDENTLAEREQAARGSELDEMDRDVDGEPMEEDENENENLDGEPMDDDEEEDMDGEPMVEDDQLEHEHEHEHEYISEQQIKTQGTNNNGAKHEEEDNPARTSTPSVPSGLAPTSTPASGSGPTPRRRRPKAEDMFADSDGE